MNISFSRHGSYMVAKISGELDLSTAQAFREKVESEVLLTGIYNLILNLKNLTFIDSTGLGALLGRHKSITGAGGRFIVCDVPPKIMTLLEMAGLTAVLDFAHTQSDAEKKLLGEEGEHGQ